MFLLTTPDLQVTVGGKIIVIKLKNLLIHYFFLSVKSSVFVCYRNNITSISQDVKLTYNAAVITEESYDNEPGQCDI